MNKRNILVVCATIKQPRTYTKISKTFFADRVQSKVEYHIKAFAGECITAMTALLAFAEEHLIDQLGEHVVALRLAVELIDWLVIATEDIAIKYLQHIADLIHKYQDAVSDLYPTCACLAPPANNIFSQKNHPSPKIETVVSERSQPSPTFEKSCRI